MKLFNELDNECELAKSELPLMCFDEESKEFDLKILDLDEKKLTDLEMDEEEQEKILNFQKTFENAQESSKLLITLTNRIATYGEKENNTDYFNLLLNNKVWPKSGFPLYATRMQNYSRSKDVLAIEMATNSLNSIWMNVVQRQKSTLLLDWTPNLVHKIIILINCSKRKMDTCFKRWNKKLDIRIKKFESKKILKQKNSKSKIKASKKILQKHIILLKDLQSAEIQEIITQHRQIIRGCKEEWEQTKITEYYAKNNPFVILKYYYFLLKRVEEIRKDREN